MVLETPEGLDTRPTSDRIKETLFNMIAFDIPDSCFLDLFSGSGQMGIALSCISKNLSKAKLDNSTVYSEDVFSALNKLNNHEVFDFVFMDPPYNKEIEKQVLEQLISKPYIDENTTVIVEASLETDFSYISDLGYIILKEKLYKTNKHIFLERA